MAKSHEEVAVEIITALIQARGQVIQSISSSALIDTYLSAETIAREYKTIHKAVVEAYNSY